MLVTHLLFLVLAFGVAHIPGLKDLPGAIQQAIGQARGLPLKLINDAATALAAKAKTVLRGKGGNAGSDGWVGVPAEKAVSISGGPHTVKLWVVVNANKQPVVMRSVDGDPAAPRDLTKDLPAGLTDDTRKALLATFSKLITDATVAIVAQRDVKNATPPPGTTGKPSPAASALVTSLTQLAKDLKVELQALIDAGATCFFGKACFAAGTPLRTPDGSKAIEDFRVGDLVLSRNEQDPHGAVEAKVVEEVFIRAGELWNLNVAGRTIETSGEHPFYVWEKGWVACNALTAGDTLLTEGGTWSPVELVESTGRWATLYNIRVADHHTYFVGTGYWGWAVWAHNAYVVTPDIEQKILYGKQVMSATGSPTREIIGAHYPRIITMSNYTILTQSHNADGTIGVKFQMQLPNPLPDPPNTPPGTGSISSPKKSTLAPVSWTDADIIEATVHIANLPADKVRPRDGMVSHVGMYKGIQLQVLINAAGQIDSSFPTSGKPVKF